MSNLETRQLWIYKHVKLDLDMHPIIDLNVEMNIVGSWPASMGICPVLNGCST